MFSGYKMALKKEILEILSDGRQSGRDVRERLLDRGHEVSLVAFYSLMSELEDDLEVFHSWHPHPEFDDVTVHNYEKSTPTGAK